LLQDQGAGMRFRFWLGPIALALSGAFGVGAEAEPRIALVIGNVHYSGDPFPKLENAAADAKLMAETLKKVGFQVLVVIDADQTKMKRAFVAFGEALANGGPLATGLFFYSGHGLAVNGRSFLIPLNAHIAREVDVSIESLSVDDIVEQMEFAANAINLLIIDGNYNSPVAKSFKSASRSVRLELPSPNFLFAYSSSPGLSLSHAGTSPYVTALMEALMVPGLSIHEVFDRVRKKVVTQTEGRQVPWESASMTDPFYFLPKN
jgi:uncharacterized caspase-like protein